MKNNRILVLSNSWGGLHSFRKEVFQSFCDNGFDVSISCPNDAPTKAEWFKQIGCHIINTDFDRQGTNPFRDLVLILKYRKLIKEINPLAVLTYTIKPNLYGGIACSLCGVPQVANITGLGAAVEYPGIMQKITMSLYRVGMRRTRYTFFQNDANKSFCEKNKLIGGETQLIPGSGVNLHYHSFQPYPSENEPLHFLFCSRIRREKGIDAFIDLAKHFKDNNNVQFDVVGDCEGDYNLILKELTSSGILTYHGRQSDVRPFYKKACCTIHPTFYPEGLSNVLLESCATGRPILTTNRPGCREVVDNGINGYIVRQQDSEDVIEKVVKFIGLSYEEKKEMGKAARRKVEKEFDRTIVVNAYLDVINKISQSYV